MATALTPTALDAGKTAQQLYAEREKRITDAIALKVPDRVPTFIIQELLPATYAGITYEQAFYDSDKWFAANEKFIKDFDPDMYFFTLAGVMTSGQTYDALGYKQMKWPGRGVSPTTPFQFVEAEYMLASEYDAFLDDPSDFLIRTYLPRTNSALEGLSLLPPFKGLIMGAGLMLPLFNIPPVTAAVRALQTATTEAARFAAAGAAFDQKMAAAGYPLFAAAVTLAPFDLITDYLRGLRGIMLDIYRCPDKLKAAQDKLLPLTIGLAVGAAQATGNPRVFIPLHRGADGFMSVKQFEEFYWPWLKGLIVALVNAGLTPIPFFEGTYNQRLGYLRELPAGKVLGWFDRSDLFRVKEVLGDVMCIAGDMPVSLLASGTPDEVRAYTRRLIENVGRGGGYIMTSNTALDDTRPELVRVWLEATREFGAY